MTHSTTQLKIPYLNERGPKIARHLCSQLVDDVVLAAEHHGNIMAEASLLAEPEERPQAADAEAARSASVRADSASDEELGLSQQQLDGPPASTTQACHMPHARSQAA